MQWGWESELLGCSSRSSNIKVFYLSIVSFDHNIVKCPDTQTQGLLVLNISCPSDRPCALPLPDADQMKEKAFFSIFLVPGLLAKSFSKASWLSLEKWELVVPLPQEQREPSQAFPLTQDGLLWQRPQSQSCSWQHLTALLSLVWGCLALWTSSWTPQSHSSLASPSVVCNVQPKSSRLEAMAAFTPECPELSRQRDDWFTDVISLSTGSQGSKILPK